jgi:hypothetical protein
MPTRTITPKKYARHYHDFMHKGIRQFLGTRLPALDPDAFWTWMANELWDGYTPEERATLTGPACADWATLDFAHVSQHLDERILLPWCYLTVPPMPSTPFPRWPRYPRTLFGLGVPSSRLTSLAEVAPSRELSARLTHVIGRHPQYVPACLGPSDVWDEIMCTSTQLSQDVGSIGRVIETTPQSGGCFGDLLALLPDLRIPGWDARYYGKLPPERRRPLSDTKAADLRARLDTDVPGWAEARERLLPVRAFAQLQQS